MPAYMCEWLCPRGSERINLSGMFSSIRFKTSLFLFISFCLTLGLDFLYRLHFRFEWFLHALKTVPL